MRRIFEPAGEKILIEVAESIRHRAEDYRHSIRQGNDILAWS
jgi:hypothetical protein